MCLHPGRSRQAEMEVVVREGLGAAAVPDTGVLPANLAGAGDRRPVWEPGLWAPAFKLLLLYVFPL